LNPEGSENDTLPLEGDDEILSASLAVECNSEEFLMRNIYETIADLMRTGEAFALTAIIKTKGSTPRRVGAKMIVLKDGKTIGTMGGADLEKRVIDEAIAAINAGEPRITSFTLDIEKGKLDMMCGGELEVYIEPVLPKAKLFIFGAGHITRVLAPLMQMAGF
jgi:xanthine dehydrogenase accessory factor